METAARSELSDTFRETFRRWRVPLDEGKAGQFARYLEILERWNKAVSLTSIRDRKTAILRDFKELEIHGSAKLFRKKLLNQDKGQARMVQAFVERIKSGGPPLIAPEEIARVTQVTFAVQESLKTRQAFGV